MGEFSHHPLQKIWKGAMILTIAGILTKVLSAVYRVPFQNIVGDVGFYIYQQVYPFYGVAIILSTYGFPVVISKLIAEHPEITRRQAAKKISRISFVFLFIMGGILFLLLYLGANVIAELMGDGQLESLIEIVAFSFLLLPLVSVWRGMFQGLGYMTPTAVSQVSEQLIRVGAILVLAFSLVRSGYSLYDAGAGAMAGSIAGGFAAVGVLFFYYQRLRKKNADVLSSPIPTSRSIIKALVLQGFTICISSLLLVFFQMVDAFTIYGWLVESGVPSQDAKELKGVYDRGQPLIQLGTVVATAFSLSLVPFIILAKGENLEKEIKDKISLSIRVSIGVGAGAAIGLAWLIQPVNTMLFSNGNGSGVLLILGLSILFCSIALTAAAILQGLGNPYVPAIYVLLGLAVKYLLNILFIPYFSTFGAALSTLLAFGLVAFLLLVTLKKKTGITIIDKSYILPLFLSVIAMSVVLGGFLLLTSSLLEENRLLIMLQSMIGVLLGGIVYIWILIRNNYFSKAELAFLPLGSKFSKLLKE